MQIYCKSCGQEVVADDVNLDNLIAKCNGCNAVYSWGSRTERFVERLPAESAWMDAGTRRLAVYFKPLS